MFKELSAPYAEYALRTTLSEEELIAGLKRECGFPASVKSSFSFGKKVAFTAKFPKGRILLTAHYGARNLPVLHITTEKPFQKEGLILHVSVRPKGLRTFVVVWYALLLFFALVVSLTTGKWLHLLHCALMALMLPVILAVCRSTAVEQMPKIRAALEELLEKLRFIRFSE